MFLDAAAIVAILAEEPEAERCSSALGAAKDPITSPIAVWEAAVAMARGDKLGLPVARAERLVTRFLEDRGVSLRDLPPPAEAVSLSLQAACRFRRGPMRLNLADCFHYACARYHRVPILSTADEFRFTDLETIR